MSIFYSYIIYKENLKIIKNKYDNIKKKDNLNYLRFENLIFPIFDEPDISFIIPCHNQINYTYNLLSSMIENISKNIKYEIILVDDFSNDETFFIEKFIKNIKIIHNKKNLFFIKSCNLASKFSKGKYLFFLNNDVVIYKNSIEYLFKTIEDNETIGVCGGKIINKDDSLQEAGQIMFDDGINYAYGHNKNLNLPEYNYIRETDYISFCAVIMRKKIFEKLNGFDEKYFPMYSEDADLSFKVRNLGYKIIYQPKSIFKHFENVSTVKSSSKNTFFTSIIDFNAWKFYKTWKKILIGNHFSRKKGKKYILLAKDRNFYKKLIFIIAHPNSCIVNDLPNCFDGIYNIKFLLYDCKYDKNDNLIDSLEQKGIELFEENYENWKNILKKYSKFAYKIYIEKNLKIKLPIKKNKTEYFEKNSIILE